MNDYETLLAIQEELDGVVWSEKTLENIASLLKQAGYRIRDKNDREDQS